MTQQIPLVGIYPRELRTAIDTEIWTQAFAVALFGVCTHPTIHRSVDQQNVCVLISSVIVFGHSDSCCAHMGEPCKHCSVKEARHKKPHTVGLHVYDMPTTGGATETEVDAWLPGTGGGKTGSDGWWV